MSEKESDVELYSSGRLGMFEYQAPATLNQASPVQNTWYTILDATANARVYGISVNVEDADETLELKITRDGQTLTGSVAATHSSSYEAHLRVRGINRDVTVVLQTTTIAEYKAFLIEGLSIKVEIRKTTATGAGNLTGAVDYGVLKDAR